MPMPQTRRETPTIFIIEDEPNYRDILVTKFMGEGFRVAISSDGSDCLEIASRINPSVILLDLILPALHGLTILKDLKTDPGTKDVPVIILSNSDAHHDQTAGLSLGAEAYLIKSDVGLDEIVLRVKRAAGL